MPLNFMQKQVTKTREKVVCEVCGKETIQMYASALCISWTMTGYAYIPQFNCGENGGSGQHWACSPLHAVEAALACLQEHLQPLMEEKIKQAKEMGKIRASVEDEALYAKYGDDFPVLAVEQGDV